MLKLEDVYLYSICDGDLSHIQEIALQARRLHMRFRIRTPMINNEILMRKAFRGLKGEIIEFEPIFSIFEGHLFVYAFPKGMTEAFVDAVGLSDKREFIKKVSTDEEALKALNDGFIPLKLQYETI